VGAQTIEEQSIQGRVPAGSPIPTYAGMGRRAHEQGTMVLEVLHLTKRFGSVVAVDDLSLHVRGGEVLGFLGPNGSGKSTTIGVALGLIAPSSGSIRINGMELAKAPAVVSEHVGAIIENPAFYP
jgi:ABC-2 type transport system ATP-binding protein